MADPATYPVLDETDVRRRLRAHPTAHPGRDPRVGRGRPRDDFEWQLKIIEDDATLNAFCAPGGFMYVYTGLIRYLEVEDHLAGVIGHEMAHADRAAHDRPAHEGVRREPRSRGCCSARTAALLGDIAAGARVARVQPRGRSRGRRDSVSVPVRDPLRRRTVRPGFFEKLLEDGTGVRDPRVPVDPSELGEPRGGHQRARDGGRVLDRAVGRRRLPGADRRACRPRRPRPDRLQSADAHLQLLRPAPVACSDNRPRRRRSTTTGCDRRDGRGRARTCRRSRIVSFDGRRRRRSSNTASPARSTTPLRRRPGTSHDVAVIGLEAGKTWDWRAVLVDGDGNRRESAPATFTVPAGADPDVEVDEALSAGTFDGWMMVSVVRLRRPRRGSASSTRDGEWVWWVESPGNGIISAELGNDGAVVVYASTASPGTLDTGHIVRVSMDGRTRTETRVIRGHHDFVGARRGRHVRVPVVRDATSERQRADAARTRSGVVPKDMTDADDPPIRVSTCDTRPSDAELEPVYTCAT